MPQHYIGQSFDTVGEDSCANATVSLVGSHLQNISVEVESDAADLSFIVSPGGARRMIAALEAALAELKRREENKTMPT